MINRALLAIAGFAGLCLSFSAPRVLGTEELNLDASALNRSSLLPSLSLENNQRFFFSTSFGWIQPTEAFLPTFNAVQPRSAAWFNLPSRKDSVDDVVELSSSDRIHVGGEIGFVYGRSTGKYGVEYQQGYVIGELGNDKFHLTVGTSYERINGHTPRWGR